MSLLSRRASARSESEPAHAGIPPAELDPDIGYFKRKALRLKRLGIKTIGPFDTTARKMPAPTRPVGADAFDMALIALTPVVEAELKAIDKHRAALEARLEHLPAGTFEHQELSAERAALGTLRAEIESDLHNPLRTDRDGRAIDDRMRTFLRVRAAELAESHWAQAERAQRAGDLREARRHRHDALRARHIAEHEMHLRASLRGYSHPG